MKIKIMPAKKSEIKEVAKLGEKFEDYQESLINKENKALLKLEKKKRE